MELELGRTRKRLLSRPENLICFPDWRVFCASVKKRNSGPKSEPARTRRPGHLRAGVSFGETFSLRLRPLLLGNRRKRICAGEPEPRRFRWMRVPVGGVASEGVA